jgi:transposase
VEPSRPTHDRVVAGGATYRASTDRVAGVVREVRGPEIEKLNQRVEEQAWERPGALLLMTHPGVGPVTALATDVFLGDPTRFADGKTLAS